MTTPSINPLPPERASIGNPVARSHAVWKGGLLYEAGVGDRTHLIDGDSKQAPSPVETLLSALGTCAAGKGRFP